MNYFARMIFLSCCVLLVPLKFVEAALEVPSVVQNSSVPVRLAKVPAANPLMTADNSAVKPEPSVSPSPGVETRLEAIDFEDMDLREALAQVARKGGLVMDCPATMEGRLTLNIEDVTLADALQVILEPMGWTWTIEGDIVHVVPLRKSTGEDSALEAGIFVLNDVSPADVLAEVRQLKSPSGRMWTDRRTNRLVVLDRPEILRAMVDVIQQRDVSRRTEDVRLRYVDVRRVAAKIREEFKGQVEIATRDGENVLAITTREDMMGQVTRRVVELDLHWTVLLEARLIQVSLNEEHKKGVDWEGFLFDYHALPVRSGSEEKTVSFGTIADEDYPNLLESLDMIGTKSDSSATRILVEGGEAAHVQLNVGTANVVLAMSSPYRRGDPSDRGERQESGHMQFYLAPAVEDENKLRLTVMPLPEMRDDKVTFAMEEDGVVVIGGIFREEQVPFTNKIPLLGDLPMLGGFFRSQNMRTRRVEYVVFLIPKVVVERPAGSDGPAGKPVF